MLVQNVLASSVSERHFKATKRSCLKYICRVQHTLRNRVPCDSLSKLDSFHLNAPCSSSFPTSCSIVPFSFASYMLSRLSCVRLFVTPWTGACQAPLSMGFSRQGYWSGSLFVVFGICTQFFFLVSHLYWVEWSPPTWKCDSCSECDFMWQLDLCRCNS